MTFFKTKTQAECGCSVDHAPRADELCPACKDTLNPGCATEHHHSVYTCISMTDVRQLRCGEYGHKECQKSGLCCEPTGERE